MPEDDGIIDTVMDRTSTASRLRTAMHKKRLRQPSLGEGGNHGDTILHPDSLVRSIG